MKGTVILLGRKEDYAGKHLLLVGTGGVKRRRVIEALRSLGLGRITCLHNERNWADPYVDDWLEADSVRPSDETVKHVRARLPKLDGVYTYDDYSVIVAAALSEQLGFPGLSRAVAERAKDKSAFRKLCVSRGLPAPGFVHSDPQFLHVSAQVLAAGLSFPVVVKPTHGAGSVFVRRANDVAELESALVGYAGALATDSVAALWPDTSVLIEEYLDGPVVDIDMLVQDGQVRYAAVTDNFAPTEPYFMELGGEIPSSLPTHAQAELIRVASATLAALGVENACVHFEARWTDRGAVPIEANLRLGGAEVYDFNRAAYGVDLVEGGVRIALGLPVPTIAPVAGCFLRSTAVITPCSGVLGDITIPQNLDRHAGFSEAVFFRGVGEQIRVPPDGFDYIGWMTARGATRVEAATHLRELTAQLRIEIAGTTFVPTPLGPEGITP